jgi:hypothetical protein
MTVTQAATRLLSHFSSEERSIPDSATYPGRNAEVLAAINGALEEMYSDAGLWLAQDERGVNLQPPASIPINVTKDSTAAVIQTADWKAWMGGCTIVIDGQEIDNQIRNNDRNVVLRYPYAGQTGVKTAVVYHDSIQLASDVLAVHEPVMIDGITIPAVSHPSVLVQTNSDRDFGFHKRSASALVRRVAASSSAPRAFSVESWRPTANSAPSTRIRLTPAPADAAFLQYVAQMTPPVITTINANNDAIPVPHNFASSVFMPIAEMRLSASPFWAGIRSPEALANNYRNALSILANANPRKNRGIRFFTRY